MTERRINRSGFEDVASFVGVPRKAILLRASLWMLIFIVILLSGLTLLYRAEYGKSKAIREAAARESVNLSVQVIDNQLFDAVSDVGYLANQNELKDLMSGAGDGSRERLAAEYAVFLRSKQVYDHVRFIDADGMEVVRANYNNGDTVIVPPEQLQDKSGRYYYREAMQTEPGVVYISWFDLNVEEGRLERPFKPALRIGMQVCDATCSKNGLVMLNYLGIHLLDRISMAGTARGTNVWMTNTEGYWLKGPENAEAWGFMLPEHSQSKIASVFPAAWKHMQGRNEGQFFSEGNLFTFIRVDPRQRVAQAGSKTGTSAGHQWILMSTVPEAAFHADRIDVMMRLFALFGMIVVILAPLSWLLAHLSMRHKALAAAMSMVLDNVPALICYVDSDRRFRFNNPAYSDFFGFNRDKITGSRLADVLGVEGYEKVRPYVNRALAGEQVSFEQRIHFRNAGTRTIAATYVPDRIDDDTVRGFFGVVNDITRLDDARESERQRLLELAHAQRINSMGEMATEIAHEINQPLATIANFSTACERTLQSEQPDLAQLLDWITKIRNHAKRASEIVRRLRAFLKNKETVHAPTDINALIEDVVEWMKGEIRNHGIDLSIELQSGIPEILADEILLQQVIMNLLRNAIEALAEAPEGTRRLTMRSTSDNETVRIAVSDTGPGIPASIEDEIFYSFVTSKEHGLGMGLSVSRSIVEAHGGSLDIDRTSASETTFVFTLPLAVQERHD